MLDEGTRRARGACGAIFFSLFATVVLIAPKAWGKNPSWQPAIFTLEIVILFLAGWNYFQSRVDIERGTEESKLRIRDWTIFIWALLWLPLHFIRYPLAWAGHPDWEIPILFFLFGLPFYNNMVKVNSKLMNIAICVVLAIALTFPCLPVLIGSPRVAFFSGVILFTASLRAVLPVLAKAPKQIA